MSRRAIILRGVSGAGKTHWANQQLRWELKTGKFRSGRIISADDHLMTEGRYRYDPSKLQEAHRRVLLDTIDWAQDEQGEDLLIIDNTNTRLVEVAPHYRLLEAYGWPVEVLTVICPIETAIERSIHVSNPAVIVEQYARLMSEPTPPFWIRKAVVS